MKKNIICLIILLALLITFEAYPAVTNWVAKGFNYASWWIGQYESAQAETSLDNLVTVLIMHPGG